MFLSTSLQNIAPRLNAPAAMPPTPELTSVYPPPQPRSKTYSEEEEEIAEALRRDIATSFVPSQMPFQFLPQPVAESAASSRPSDPGAAAAIDGAEFPCNHCGKIFMSPYAVNGHKTHSKECSAKGRGLE